jgi:hypothetical protein
LLKIAYVIVELELKKVITNVFPFIWTSKKRRKEVIRKYWAVHKKEFHNTYSLPVTVGMIKSSSMNGQHMEHTEGMQKYLLIFGHK